MASFAWSLIKTLEAKFAIEKEGRPMPAPISKTFFPCTHLGCAFKKSQSAMEDAQIFAQNGKGVFESFFNSSS